MAVHTTDTTRTGADTSGTARPTHCAGPLPVGTAVPGGAPYPEDSPLFPAGSSVPGGTLDELEIITMAEDSVLYESPYLGQHGIALLARARSGSTTLNVLMDVGQDPDALLVNFSRMGIRPSELDAIVITHCHYDHTQGLARIVAATGKKDVPVIVHPDLFRPNFVTGPVFRDIGVQPSDSEEAITIAGGKVFKSRTPVLLMPGLFTTGQVPRRTAYEEAGISGLSTIENGRVVPDPMDDDISLVAVVGGHDPVILTGCSHAGIVNIARHVADLTGAHGFENIIGGFHLIEAADGRIARTVDDLAGFRIHHLTPGHCTGFRAQAAMLSRFGDAFEPLHTGMRFSITAVRAIQR